MLARHWVPQDWVHHSSVTEEDTLMQLVLSLAVSWGAAAGMVSGGGDTTGDMTPIVGTASAPAEPTYGVPSGLVILTGLRSPSHVQIWGGHDFAHVFWHQSSVVLALTLTQVDASSGLKGRSAVLDSVASGAIGRAPGMSEPTPAG
jgi:hypothetical protein